MFEIELIICIKMDLALNNLQRLICYKTQPTNQPTNQHKVDTCKYMHKKETITTISAGTKGFHGQLVPTEHLLTQILELKRNHTLIKTISSIKAKNKDNANRY